MHCHAGEKIHENLLLNQFSSGFWIKDHMLNKIRFDFHFKSVLVQKAGGAQYTMQTLQG